MKFCPEHFPAGTLCLVQIFEQDEPRLEEVVSVVQNGISSYCIKTTSLSEVYDGNYSVNISHVIKIIKRGSGLVKYENREPSDTSWLYLPHNGAGRSRTYYIASVINRVVIPMVPEGSCLDLEKLEDIIISQGIFQAAVKGECLTIYKFDGKKLKKAINRVLNKCLLNVKKENRLQYEEWLNLDN